MGDCCERAHTTIFDEKSAARDLQRYRRKGLSNTARRLVEVLESKGLRGASIIDVGGGIGVITVELLTRGAARAVSAELVSAYEPAASELLEERGLSGRVDRRVLDFAHESAEIPAADVVVLHRVVCCYADAPALVSAAAAHAERVLAMTFPPDRWWWRLAVRIANAWLRARASGFRAFVHKPSLIDRIAREAGLQVGYRHVGLTWQTVIYERVS